MDAPASSIPATVKLVVLKLLSEQPSYGYQLIKTMEQRLSGGYTPSAGVIYPTLTMIEEEGLTASTNCSNASRRPAKASNAAAPRFRADLHRPRTLGKPQPPFVAVASQLVSPILESGCGTGNAALFFAAPGHQVTAIDFPAAHEHRSMPITGVLFIRVYRPSSGPILLRGLTACLHYRLRSDRTPLPSILTDLHFCVARL